MVRVFLWKLKVYHIRLHTIVNMHQKAYWVCRGVVRLRILFEPWHGKAGAPSEDSYLTGLMPSMVRVFAERIKNLEVISYILSELQIL